MFISVKDVYKKFGEGDAAANVLNGISFEVDKGALCVVVGPSGSGKSTLMNLMGGLDTIDSGEITVNGTNLSGLSMKQLSKYRRKELGFVFQFYNLIPNLTLRDNILSCEYLAESPLDVDELIDVLGLTEHQHKYPSQVSGGQQQRCAIARALIKNPNLLMCDEPTGALDTKTTKDILVLLDKINKKYGTTIIIITHNLVIMEMATQILSIKDGKIYEELFNENPKAAAELVL